MDFLSDIFKIAFISTSTPLNEDYLVPFDWQTMEEPYTQFVYGFIGRLNYVFYLLADVHHKSISLCYTKVLKPCHERMNRLQA